MEKYHDYTRARLAQLATRMRDSIYAERLPLAELFVSERQDERIAFEKAQKLRKWRPAKIGEQFGPLWSTYWFRAKAEVPKSWKGRRVDLLWASHSEATLWIGGKSAQGLNHTPMSFDQSTRPDAVLIAKAKGGEQLDFQIEMACNKLFGYDEDFAPHYTSISPYILDQAEIALFDQQAWDLYFDFAVLQELEADGFAHKDLDSAWSGRLLSELNRFSNEYDATNRKTWMVARQILQALLTNRNGDFTHNISSIGHAHIDTAWLWPLAETQRKCERSFSSQTTYMAEYPEYKFACSQAQQYEWIADRNPDLYKRIKKFAKGGQWVPVGGTWIEPDCNIPSGESLVRQFLFGQRFFEKEFGRRCREFWNPDVFGYNGQLPQICQGAGIARFVTQKLSWNRFNKPRHQSFIWEGIDGSKVMTHFPPADNYNANPNVATLRESARKYKDSDRTQESFLLFGYGDGGGGPTKAMLEYLRRAGDLQGIPKTVMRSSDEFFEALEANYQDRVRMVGELYFEYHRGTYTSQAATKLGNRKSEILLHDVEFLASWAMLRSAAKKRAKAYPKAAIDGLWKLVLLNQFHDILPGSSIGLVYEDAHRQYAEIAESGEALRLDAVEAVMRSIEQDDYTRHRAVMNTTGFAREEVVTGADGKLQWAAAPAYGIGATATTHHSVFVQKLRNRNVVLENSFLRAELSAAGSLISLIEQRTEREVLAAPGNQLLMYNDEPTAWAAWDVDPQHMETERPCAPATRCAITCEDDLRVEVTFTRAIGEKSRMTQIVRLDAGSRRLEFHCDVNWHESNKMLKVAFPLNVRAMNVTYEMQFGAVERPTHFNTTHDLAKYEVPGHRWADMGEHGFGVALLSESKYGWSAHGNVLRMSLLRSPKHPDPECDMGRHRFAYAIMPHEGSWQQAGVVREAAAFNMPLIVTEQKAPIEDTWLVALGDDAASQNLVIDTVKRAEANEDLIVRLYECHGARGVASVKVNHGFTRVVYCNLLEDETAIGELVEGTIKVNYSPWQIITLRLQEN